MPRLFTGLEIPASSAAALAARAAACYGARWIEPEDYHITLRFIGDVDAARGARGRRHARRHPPPAGRVTSRG